MLSSENLEHFGPEESESIVTEVTLRTARVLTTVYPDVGILLLALT